MKQASPSRRLLSALSTAIAVAVALGPVLAGQRVAYAQSTEGLGMPQPERPAEPPAIDAQTLTKPPKQIKFVEAEYPKEALDKGIAADVVLLLDINAEGKVDSVGIAEPTNPPGMGFYEAALVPSMGARAPEAVDPGNRNQPWERGGLRQCPPKGASPALWRLPALHSLI